MCVCCVFVVCMMNTRKPVHTQTCMCCVYVPMFLGVVENVNFQTRSISESVQNDRSRTSLERWSEGCDEVTLLKLKIKTCSGMIKRYACLDKVDTIGGPRNESVKRILFVNHSLCQDHPCWFQCKNFFRISPFTGLDPWGYSQMLQVSLRSVWVPDITCCHFFLVEVAGVQGSLKP